MTEIDTNKINELINILHNISKVTTEKVHEIMAGLDSLDYYVDTYHDGCDRVGTITEAITIAKGHLNNALEDLAADSEHKGDKK